MAPSLSALGIGLPGLPSLTLPKIGAPAIEVVEDEEGSDQEDVEEEEELCEEEEIADAEEEPEVEADAETETESESITEPEPALLMPQARPPLPSMANVEAGDKKPINLVNSLGAIGGKIELPPPPGAIAGSGSPPLLPGVTRGGGALPPLGGALPPLGGSLGLAPGPSPAKEKEEAKTPVFEVADSTLLPMEERVVFISQVISLPPFPGAFPALPKKFSSLSGFSREGHSVVFPARSKVASKRGPPMPPELRAILSWRSTKIEDLEDANDIPFEEEAARKFEVGALNIQFRSV